MARYVFKKKKKLVRRFGPINGLPSNVKRTSRPGMHGKKREGKQSEFGKGLFNKNKLRACFGISEKQFRNYFAKAVKAPDTGEALLQILEFRLDNLVYRLGLAPSLPAARQMVIHGHIFVQKLLPKDQQEEGKDQEIIFTKVDKPGYRVKAKQKIKLAAKLSKKLPPAVEQSIGNALRVDYVEFEESNFSGCFTRVPAGGEIPAPVEVAKIIEFSSRRL
ncbi:MAG: 30S ribosomal protein S4 [Candidatus Caenarcaniphilales bacterium]|nr:30S ribosomal protein S4 [Candidatus Caenarcaniphilales bacterium]